MQSPGAHASRQGGREMNLYDRIDQFLPARACDLGDVTILVGHGPGWAEDHTVDGNGAELSLLIDRRLLGDKLLAAIYK